MKRGENLWQTRRNMLFLLISKASEFRSAYSQPLLKSFHASAKLQRANSTVIPRREQKTTVSSSKKTATMHFPHFRRREKANSISVKSSTQLVLLNSRTSTGSSSSTATETSLRSSLTLKHTAKTSSQAFSSRTRTPFSATRSSCLTQTQPLKQSSTQATRELAQQHRHPREDRLLIRKQHLHNLNIKHRHLLLHLPPLRHRHLLPHLHKTAKTMLK